MELLKELQRICLTKRCKECLLLKHHCLIKDYPDFWPIKEIAEKTRGFKPKILIFRRKK